MRAINYRNLKQQYEAKGPEKTALHLREALDAKELKPDDFSIRELAEVFMGTEWVRNLDPRRGTVILEGGGDGVDSTAFSNITGQIVYSRIMEAYASPAFWASGAVQTIPTRFDGEKIPGIATLKDETNIVNEGMPYESKGFGEDYIETPATYKRGFIVPVTKEAIFFDRTGLILSRAAEVGTILGLDKEKRILDVILGVTSAYKWKGTSYSTYVSTPWDNTITDELIDWSDIDAAEQLFAAMTDPNTGEPILMDPANVSLVVMPNYKHAARRILRATEIDYGIPSSATVQTITKGPNTVNPYTLQDNTALAKARLVASGVSAGDAAKYWYLGNFRKAFAYMENWPITVTQAPTNSEAEFTADIVARFKCSERGAAAVLDPRYVVQSTGAG